MRGCPLQISPEIAAANSIVRGHTTDCLTSSYRELQTPKPSRTHFKMTATAAPEVTFGVLPRADGSAKYSHAGYSVLASVNGPIEAQRRDEHAYEAHVDVIVRPAAGVGGGSPRAGPDIGRFLTMASLYRDPGTAPRVDSAVFALPDHPRQELSPLSHPDRASG
jgi:hypothetical protein